MAILVSNKQKHHVFLIIFYAFSSTKSQNKRVGLCPEAGVGWGGDRRVAHKNNEIKF
jgi:hypothetical protein